MRHLLTNLSDIKSILIMKLIFLNSRKLIKVVAELNLIFEKVTKSVLDQILFSI